MAQRWGHSIHQDKPDDHTRIAFLNLRGLPWKTTATKHDQVKRAISKHNIDFFGLLEVNLNFRQLSNHSQWRDRFPSCDGVSGSTYNEHNTSASRRLFGGVGTIAGKFLSNRFFASGNDPRGLGRWRWNSFRGRHRVITRIIMGYRPVTDTSDKAGSVFSQHKTFLRTQGIYTDPRQQFFVDLDVQIRQWLLDGDQLVLGLDANEDVWNGGPADYAVQWGLVNAMRTSHPYLPSVGTHDKNTTGTAVDGLWVTPGLSCENAGMTGFGEIAIEHADHRMLWIDIPNTALFGFRPPIPQSRPTQRLNRTPSVVSKYNRLQTAKKAEMNLVARTLGLHKKIAAGQFLPEDTQEYEAILTQDLEARRFADSRCRRIFTGALEWSPQLASSNKELHMWRLFRKHRSGYQVHSKTLRRLTKRFKRRDAYLLSVAEIDLEIVRSKAAYLANKARDKELRQDFRNELVQDRAASLGTSKATQTKLLHNAFRQKQVHRRIKLTVGKGLAATFSHVTYVNLEGHTITCETQPSIESACQNEGYSRYTQAASTPFLQAPLVHDFGYLADTPSGQAVLDGRYEIPPTVDQYTAKYITELAAPQNIPPIALPTFTTAKFTDGWKRMKFFTSSSPFGPSFKDLKASGSCAEMATLDTALLNIPILTGYLPRRWRRAIDVMIPKKSTTTAVNKLRIIVLFDAMFNLLNKKVGRDMLAHAETHKQIPWEAYGSRKGYRAVDCALNKVLTMDLARQLHIPLALCSNDAKSCYDRIIHAIAALCMRRLGVDSQTCSMMFGTLQQMQHYVRTTYGDSSSFYTSIELPLQGILQGNGAGPAIWLVISIPLINMLKNQGFGFKIRSATTNEVGSFVCYTFVDDTDLVHAGSPNDNALAVAAEMQEALRHWEGGLRATGGAFATGGEPPKNYWYLVSWRYANHRWHYRTVAETPATLTIHDTSGNPYAIQRYKVNVARETLGVWIAMDGNQTAQVAALRQKVDLWTDKIRTKSLNTIESWVALTSGISKSLEYPLTATCLTRRQCASITGPLFSAALPSLGIPSKFPRVVVHSPPTLMGIGIPNLWDSEGLAHVDAILRHGTSTTITGIQLRATFEVLLLEVSLPIHPFDANFKTFGHLATSSWITSLWDFLSTANFELRPPNPLLILNREHNLSLLQAFADHGYRGKDLYILNLCRKFLRCIRLSDISTGDGRHIRHSSWHGTEPGHPLDNTNWPVKSRPTDRCWSLWQTALESCFLLLGHTRQRTLRRPLGPWTRSPPGWAWWYSPNDLVPTTIVSITPTHLRHEGCVKIDPPDEPDTDIPWWHVPLDREGRIQDILLGIQAGTAVIVADGSFKNSVGTAAYILQDRLESPLASITAMNLTPGRPRDQSAYRAEVGGIRGAVGLINWLTKKYNITAGSVTIGCDCQSGLTALFNWDYVSPWQPNFDLLLDTRSAIASSDVIITSRYVKGHADDSLHFSILDPWEQLNVRMDIAAKAFWQTATLRGFPAFSLPPTTKWSLWHHGQRIPHFDKKELLEIMWRPAAHKYWGTRLAIADPEVCVAWQATASALKNTPLFRRLWIPKWLTRHLPTSNKMHQWGRQVTSNCPRCGEVESSVDHVLQCTSPQVTEIWDNFINESRVWLHDRHTHPDLREGVLHYLEHWRKKTPPPIFPSTDPAIRQLFQAQTDTGWRLVAYGVFRPEWAHVQQSYYSTIGRRSTGYLWLSKFIRHIWCIPWRLWSHRQTILDSPNSLVAAAAHDETNLQIFETWTDYALNPLPYLSRYFSRSCSLVQAEPLDAKLLWLQATHVPGPPAMLHLPVD